MFDVGRLCVKTAGRETGKICCIVKTLDPTFVLVTGPREVNGVRRRKCNIQHLEPLQDTVPLAADASDQDVLKAYQSAGVIEKYHLAAPTAEERRQREERRAEKEKARKAREEQARKEREALEKKLKEGQAAQEAERKSTEEKAKKKSPARKAVEDVKEKVGKPA